MTKQATSSHPLMILSHNRIASFPRWLQGFREHAVERSRAGLIERGIFQSVQGDEVFVLLDSIDPQKTETFLASKELTAFKEQIGVREQPRYHRVTRPVTLGSPQGLIQAAFNRIDSMDARGFAETFAPHGRFQFANLPEVVGLQGIEEFCAGFFGSIQSLRHEILGTFEGVVTREHADAVAIPCAQVRGFVHYQRKNGTSLSVPFSNYFEVDDQGRFTVWQIFADTSALYQTV